MNTPVNPTGYVFRAHDLDAIAAALAGTRRAAALRRGVCRDPLRRPRAPLARRRIRSCASGRSCCAASRRPTRWPPGASASRLGPAHAIERWRTTFAWQALAIDGVAQAAAHAALTGPQGWIEAARAELAEMRPRAIEAANATGVLRAELPEAAAFVWAAVDGDEDDLERPPCRATTASRRSRAGTSRAATPHLRIPFGGRREAREALLERLAALAD